MNALLDGLETDIPREVAYRAHTGTSFVPDRRAEQEQAGYAETLRTDYAQLHQLAEKNGTLDLLDEQFARYRQGYKRRQLEYLGSRNGLVSTMIAGPSGFPTRRMEKKGNSVHNRLNAVVEYRRRALEAIRRKLSPSARPIMAGDADAVSRLQEKIAEAERLQERMKAVNAAHKAYLKRPESIDTAAISELDKMLVLKYKPAYSWEPHPFAPYELTNNNANIRRMKERLAGLERAKVAEAVELKGEHATYEDCPAENRVRLYFPGKPDADIRGRLKSGGFRWAPSLGCWQAYRNSRTLPLAREVAGISA